MAKVQIKPLALGLFAQRLPAFHAYAKSKPGYWFRRRSDGLTDILVCTASERHGHIEIDLYCGIDDDWAGSYGTRLLGSGRRLDNLRYSSNALDVTRIGYRHDRSPAGITAALQAACDDIERFAVPYFAEFRQRFAHNRLVVAARAWMREQRHGITAQACQEIRAEHAAKGVLGIQHPLYVALKSHLWNLDGISRDERKEISMLAVDVFAWFAAAADAVCASAAAHRSPST